MQSRVTTAANLLEVFAAKAAAPPSESSQMLVRHLQCEESLNAADCLTEEVPPPQPVMREKRRDTVPSGKAQRPIFISRLFMASHLVVTN
jgi:hypothetical protein